MQVDVVAAPDVPPVAAADGGDDLPGRSWPRPKSKLDAGEAFGGMAQRKPVVDEIHEAIAELDPRAAAIVNAAKAHRPPPEDPDRVTIRDLQRDAPSRDPRDGRHDARPEAGVHRRERRREKAAILEDDRLSAQRR